jgi:hypothetical protein
MRYKFIIFWILVFGTVKLNLNQIFPKLAVISVPVADLTIKPLDCNGELSADQWHDNFGFSPNSGQDSCPRESQLFFNDIITIISESKNEVCLKTTDLSYWQVGKLKNTFWTLKKNIKYLEDLQLDFLPTQVNYNGLIIQDYNDIVLTEPLKINNTIYSIGTRFKKVADVDDFKSFIILVPDFVNNSAEFFTIEANKVVIYKNWNLSKAHLEFLKILNKLALVESSEIDAKLVIPYVWGGKSMGYRLIHNDFYISKEKRDSQEVTYWNRPDKYKTVFSGHMGCDCSGLILLAARVAGLNYNYCNTATIYKFLKPLKSENIVDGDLIWFPGHVMLVSDVSKNLLIESRAYGSGYGMVHSIPLNEAFFNINSYTELVQCYFKQKPLKLKNSYGKVVKTINEFKLLKLFNDSNFR